MTNLTNFRQIPIATQRSDDWLMEETPIKFPLPPGVDPRSRDRQINGKLNKEMELIDRERLILEAEATVAELKETFLADKKAWEEAKAKEEERVRAEHENAR